MKTSALFIVLLFGFISISQAHNWLQSPISRGNQQQSQTGCRMGGEGNEDCPGPCDRTVSQITIAPIAIQRGESLPIQWNMHTHEGGFIRFAWCPTSESDSKECFNEYVQLFVCKEIGGCDPNQPVCSFNVTTPSFITDGAWTLQWAYFGGWYNAGDYYACVDYQVSGGTAVGIQQPTTFIGGDYHNPDSDECLFFSTNALGVCVEEPCMNGTFPIGVNQTGAPKGFNPGDTPYGSSSSSSVPTPSPMVPTPSTPATTGQANPLTTQAIPVPIISLTTAAMKVNPSPQPPSVRTTSRLTTGIRPSIPITTGAAIATPVSTSTPYFNPITTASAEVIPTSTTSDQSSVPPPRPTCAPISSPMTTFAYSSPPSDSTCVSGYMQCLSDGTFSTCNNGVWGISQPCGPGTTCSPSGNYIYCIIPIQSPSTVPIQISNPSSSPTITPVSSSSSTTSSTPSPTNTPIQTGSCTLGNQRCVNGNSYETCGYGSNGPTWSEAQQCQPSLSCHPSSTANNIYCY